MSNMSSQKSWNETINEVDLNTLIDNTFSLNLLLEQVYSEEEAKLIFNKIFQCAYQLKHLYGNNDLKDEYNKYLKFLNEVVNRIIDDYETLSVVPIEVKSGKDYMIHSALNNFIENKDYNVKVAYVLSNERKIINKNNKKYVPIYNIMFL